MVHRSVECSRWGIPWIRAWKWVIGKAKPYTDIWTFAEGWLCQALTPILIKTQ